MWKRPHTFPLLDGTIMDMHMHMYMCMKCATITVDTAHEKRRAACAFSISFYGHDIASGRTLLSSSLSPSLSLSSSPSSSSEHS